MSSTYGKIIFRSIKGSIARFIAILAIIALGVGFFAGLKLTTPSLIETANTYIRNQNLYDFRFISTIGFNDDDIAKISKIDGVTDVEGAVSVDALIMSNMSESTEAVKFHSITNDVNSLKLVTGRMPQSDNEVVVDDYVCSDSLNGTKIYIVDANSSSTSNSFTYSEYTVVGSVLSPYYMNFQRGATNIGSGEIKCFFYMPIGGFTSEYYTEAFCTCENNYYVYSDAYDDFAENMSDKLEGEIETIINARYDDLMSDGRQELADASELLEDKRSETAAEIEDAANQLNDAEVTLSDARTQLSDAGETLQTSRAQLDDARAAIDSNSTLIAQNDAQLRDAGVQLTDAANQISAQRAQLDTSLSQLNEAKVQLQAHIDQINQAIAQSSGATTGTTGTTGEPSAALDELTQQYQALVAQLEQVNVQINQVNQGYAALDAAQAQLDAKVDDYNSAMAALNSAKQQFQAALDTLNAGEAAYESGLEQYNQSLADYNDGVEQLSDSRREYLEGLAEFNAAMSTANSDICSAFSKILNADSPDIYVLRRDTNVGYLCFNNDAQIVDGIAEVFPLFFFMIAALVCSTTMSRMVAEERGVIGTMRAMGYTEFSIIMKYVIYSGLAAVIGCTVGFLVGTKVFPAVIWSAYGMMYGFSDIVYKQNYVILLISLIVSLLCSVGTTVITCAGELKSVPAELIRPKAPSAGKRILLENFTPIWSKLKFLYKVSARNVFRFKKRMWMMIIGIAGCTSLVIAGFGIRDSVANIIDYQFDDIMTYDISMSFSDNTTRDKMTNLLDSQRDKSGVDYSYVLTNSSNIKYNGKTKISDVVLIASDDVNVSDAIKLHSGDTEFDWPADDTVAISQKLADENHLKKGDTITFQYGDEGKSFSITIGYVFDNYVYHYAIINAATYEKIFGVTYKPNNALLVLPDSFEKGLDYDIAASIANDSSVDSYQVVSQARDNFSNTMSRLNYVVILVIGCAAMLAFIVLFNLNNINITERIREIATLKVLGFNKRETGAYVFRENFILVFLGFLFGTPLGIVFHAFVISKIQMDLVTFVVTILPQSYVYSLGTVLLFSVFVDLVMRGKIEKIDMAESLKSIE